MGPELIGTIAWCTVPLVGLVLILKHKRDMARIARGSADDTAINELRTRCETLEKRCEKLEGEVLSAHNQLADERRELDRKLTAMLPDASAGQTGSSKSGERIKTIQ